MSNDLPNETSSILKGALDMPRGILSMLTPGPQPSPAPKPLLRSPVAPLSTDCRQAPSLLFCANSGPRPLLWLGRDLPASR